jgi:hypothetical protein
MSSMQAEVQTLEGALQHSMSKSRYFHALACFMLLFIQY